MKVQFESKRVGDISVTSVQIGSITSTLKQVGDVKHITTTGRGNVRQAKTIAKELHKTIQ